MNDASGAPTENGWLVDVWKTLDERSQSMLTMKVEKNRTFSSIGRAHGVTRERARQIITKAQEALSATAWLVQPDWATEIFETLEGMLAISDEEVRKLLPDDRGVVRESLLLSEGLRHPRAWRRELSDHWALAPDALDGALRALVEAAPYREEELVGRSLALGIPRSISIESIMSDNGSALLFDEAGFWVRKTSKKRDVAYLWLAEQGAPMKAEAIARALNTNAHALTELLRRDPRFRQLRPESVWALVEWPAEDHSEHTNALDVVVEVLTEFGPMRRGELLMEVRRRYVVSESRIQQCLISDRIGRTTEGLIGLIAHGALVTEEREPQKPADAVHNEEAGLMAFRLKVNKDIVRGSGVSIRPWITWQMGLRRAPMERVFLLEGTGHQVVFRRMTSGAQMSSLRRLVAEQGLNLECELAVVVRLEEDTVAIRHVCEPGACGG